MINLMKRELKEDNTGVWVTVIRENRRITYKNREGTEEVKQQGSMYYIAPMERYRGEVLRDENDVIVELIFRKTEEKEEA